MKDDRKRLEAIERQEHYDSLTTKQKLQQARSRRGSSAKEIKRLEAKLAKEERK